MALTHTIIEVRPYLDGWLSKVDITDGSRVWHEQFNTPTKPTPAEGVALISAAKTRIQKDLDFEANDMSLTVDEVQAVYYLRRIKRQLITAIRANPALTLTQVQTYIANNYPNSIINFDKLYAYYLNLLNLTTWAQFKTWVIDHKFRGID